MTNILFAFMLTLFAGLATGIGGLIALSKRASSKRFLSISLGFSAGVMIYVSFVEIFQKAKLSLSIELGDRNGTIATVAGFFGGMLFIGIIDKLIPSDINPHESFQNDGKSKAKLMRMGTFTALAIAIHNFPEGLATFVSALQSPNLAIPIVIAIALHNIPEGVAVAMPIYQATNSRKKAFLYSLISGIFEPLGALVGWLLFLPIMTDLMFGIIFSAVGGIMVFISIDELLPASREYGKGHDTLYGLISGMVIMAISLILFLP